MPEFLDIFVGTDRSQLFAVAVLEHSIVRRTKAGVRVCPLIDLDLPEPSNFLHGSRTGFSFARFAIPELMGYRGRALYLDADMLVLKDIAALWEMPFGGARIIIQDELPHGVVEPKKVGAPEKRTKQCSVMMIDCAAVDWVASDIIAGLDGRYTYDELMSQMCILDEADVSYSLPFAWNSLEHWDEGTCLLHYTDMRNQPWVSPQNPLGHLWLSELRHMIDTGVVGWEALKGEVELGYFRPSLLDELNTPEALRRWDQERANGYEQQDRKAGFEKHAEVFRRKRERRRQIEAYVAEQERLKALEAGEGASGVRLVPRAG
jgi:hypothetical protein